MKTPKIYDILPPKEGLKKYIPPMGEGPSKEGARKIPGPTLKRGKIWNIAGGLLILLVVIFGAVYFRFLEARITVWPVQERWEFQKEVGVKVGIEGINAEAGIIPGRIIKAEEELFRQFSASGEAAKESKAKGVIRVYNNYHLVQILVATTRFLSSEGKLFRSTQRVSIPPGGQADVEVEAAELGESYNIEPSTFSIPGLAGTARYTQVYGKSSAKMEGGSKRVVPQVTAEDIKTAKDSITQDLTKEGQAKILAEIEQDKNLVFLDKALSQDTKEVETLVSEGAEVDNFQAKGKVIAKALVFSREDADKFIRGVIASEIGAGKALNEQSLELQFSLNSIDWDQELMSLSVSGSVNLYPDIDIDELKSEISGKALGAARDLLKGNRNLERFQIKLWPLPWRSVPKDIDRIKVDLKLD